MIPNVESLLLPRLLLVKGESDIVWGMSAPGDLECIVVRRAPDT